MTAADILQPLGHSQVTPDGRILGDSATGDASGRTNRNLDRFGRAQAGQLFRRDDADRTRQFEDENPACDCGARGGWHVTGCPKQTNENTTANFR